MNNIIPFDFEDKAVRVIMIDDEPWFVAADLCAVLSLPNVSQAVSRLDDDEATLISNEGGGNINIVSESGMYSLVLGSRKPEARRFKKWITSQLLPTLRRTGRYILHDAPHRPLVSADIDPPRIMAAVALTNAARRLYGIATARRVWAQCGLPVAIADATAELEDDPFAASIAAWATGRSGFSIEECAEGIGVPDLDLATRLRIGRLLRALGFRRHTVRRGDRIVNVFIVADGAQAAGA
ncbi:Bro-N domain-containing protein [Sphingobium sp. HT1-2]|uniref:BRO-N domain-containing protein n=1 Tax=Sphingobium sp. HT1-2 TaxID=3111640 RepID=UPI003C01E6C9